MHIYRLENPMQHYAWGSPDGLSKILDVPNPEGSPLAELWMGAHPKAPSMVLMEGKKLPLDVLIRENPTAALGKDSIARFGDTIPFLFKAISAETPLSIQAHPSKRKAEHGFDHENLAGIPVDAPERNYRDTNHKPELVLALSRFEALCGFRPISEIVENIRLISPDHFPRFSGKLEKNPGKVELSMLFFSMISQKDEEKRDLLDKIKPQVEVLLETKAYPKDREAMLSWMLRLCELFPGDIGAIAPLVLNYVALEPGEAMYLAPGELHAYLKGSGLEIMANSDNVIRGALTRKHIDVPELLSVLTFNHEHPAVIDPVCVSGYEETYPTPAPDFRLSRICSRKGQQISRAHQGPEILLCTEGQVLLSEGGGQLSLRRGDSAFVSADSGDYALEGEAILYVAAVSPAS